MCKQSVGSFIPFIVSVHRSDVEPDVVMEGGSLAAGDFSQNLKQSNQELEEECVKLQDVVDKLVTFAERAISNT